MPIYAYKCASCGFAKDALQKLSDAPLTECPSCGKSTFQKQVTAAGFQLKGSGWYATDFKGAGAAPSTAVAPATTGGSDAAPAASADSSGSKTEAAPAATPAPAAKPTPAAG